MTSLPWFRLPKRLLSNSRPSPERSRISLANVGSEASTSPIAVDLAVSLIAVATNQAVFLFCPTGDGPAETRRLALLALLRPELQSTTAMMQRSLAGALR